MRTLPPIVNKLCYLHDAWIVSKPVDGEEPRDWDVIVAFSNWKDAAALIPAAAKPNAFGGWKFTDEGKVVDVWPGEMAWLMTNAAWMGAWHPKTNTRVIPLDPFRVDRRNPEHAPSVPRGNESYGATGVSCPKCSSLSSALATAQADAEKKDLGKARAVITKDGSKTDGGSI